MGGALVVAPRKVFGIEVPTHQKVVFEILLPFDPAEELPGGSIRFRAQVDGGNGSVSYAKLAAYRHHLFMTRRESGRVDAALWDVGSHKDGGLFPDHDIVCSTTTPAGCLVRDVLVKVAIVGSNL